MIRKFKYITALFLMLIIPISAVGLNLYVHKCSHKHTFHLSLIGFEKNYNCCNPKIIKQPQSKPLHSCCNNKVKANVDSENQIQEQKHSHGLNYSGLSCCSNQQKTLALNSTYIPNENVKEISIVKDSHLNLITHNQIETNDNVRTEGIRKYPIKELIFNIISFIHNNSFSGDNSDVAAI